jgi:ADP-dependent NAD(P)H-hydrate dehydratase / NAD(P)H-hydrate epimerase
MDTVPDDPVPGKPSRSADTVPDDPVPGKPSRSVDTVPDDPVPDKPKRRSSFKIFAGVVLFLAVFVTLGVATHRLFIRDWIVKDALARGFELEFGDFTIQPDLVELLGVKVKIVGVPGIEARFETLKVHLHDFEPLKIDGQKSIVQVTGSPDELQPKLVAFAKTHNKSVRLPLKFDGQYRYGTGDKPNVELTGDLASPGDGELSFNGSLELGDAKLGSLALHRSKDDKLEIGLGLNISDKPIVSLALDVAAVPFKGKVTFGAQKVQQVCRAFAVPVPKGMDDVMVEGNVSFVLDGSLPTNPHHGTGAFVLTGWVPPHPRELDGIVFGKTTKLGTTFELLPDLGEMRLVKTTVDAGALHLEGKGNVVRDGFAARAKVDLTGSVPCTELSASAIGSHVRGFVGDILRGVARMTMGGTVKIRVNVDADTTALSAAKVDQTVDIGCRLR